MLIWKFCLQVVKTGFLTILFRSINLKIWKLVKKAGNNSLKKLFLKVKMPIVLKCQKKI